MQSRLTTLVLWMMMWFWVIEQRSLLASDLFENRIRPLLVDRCLECHNPDNASGGLSLADRPSMLRGGEHGPAIHVADPSNSLILKAIRREGDLQMPPDHPLTPLQVGWFEQWIAAGAEWPDSVSLRQVAWDERKDHWAFQPIREPTIPEVNDASWCFNAVDRFVLAKLERSFRQPQALADRRTLIRRVTIDLTGLLPSYEDVEEFIHDERPDAYSRLVDRLLASPYYGQQMGRDWLDVARYSDTKGYVYAREERFFAQAPSYRDWVVRALNRDLAYDQFLKYQIAADAFAAERLEEWPAMGFMTMGRRFLGVTHDIIDDRIDVVTRGTMGLTVSCARCHDHKYDPITTAEYYGLYGIFQNCHEKQVVLSTLSREAKALGEGSPFAMELAKRQKTLEDQLAQDRREASERVRNRIADYLMAQLRLAQFPEEGFDQILQGEDLFPAFVRRWEAYLNRQQGKDPVMVVWNELASFAHLPEEAFTLEAARRCAEWSSMPTWKVHPRIAQAFQVPPKSMQEVADRYQGVFQDRRVAWSPLASQGGAPPIQHVAEADRPLWELLYGVESPCEVPNESIVTTESYFPTKVCENLWKLQGEVDRWLLQSAESPSVAQLLLDRPTFVPPRILKRGNPANKGAVVPRRFLQALTQKPWPLEEGSGRAQLAEAIVDPQNPLTARVWINRLWQHHFGTGLVKTASDFGLRAEPPSHPELLDWLAIYLQRHHWSTKEVQRLIVKSATYQQATVLREESQSDSNRDQDPENRLLSKQNRHRLRFEEMRDVWLQVAGLLNRRMGGTAEPLFALTANIGANSSALENRNGTRRSLYGLIDRQFLDSQLRLFDFANPDLHIPKRSETLVPQQALFAMNHPFLGACARHLNAISQSEDQSSQSRVERMFQKTLQRMPTDDEVREALSFVKASEADEPLERTLAEGASDWSYGYGRYDEQQQRVTFSPLPHFQGTSWQGGAAYPDATLGWVQLSAKGGHPGNDAQHASIRRWTAPIEGTLFLTASIEHVPEVSDGIRCRMVSNRRGLLGEWIVHHTRVPLNFSEIPVQKGETIDFVTDIREELHHDEFHWTVEIRHLEAAEGLADGTQGRTWNSERDFVGPQPDRLDPWEQLAQVLLLSNELLFLD